MFEIWNSRIRTATVPNNDDDDDDDDEEDDDDDDDDDLGPFGWGRQFITNCGKETFE